MHYKDLATIENSAVKNNKWSKILKLTEEELRWLDLKHIWAPWWTREPTPCSVNSPVILNTEGVKGLLCLLLSTVVWDVLPRVGVPPLWHHSGPEQEAIKGAAAVYRIHQWKIFIWIYTPATLEGRHLLLKRQQSTGNTWKVTKHQIRRWEKKIKNTKTLGWEGRRVKRRGNSLKE